MKLQKERLIEHIKNVKGKHAYINALYEVVVEEDYDYIENLFPTNQDFEDFIDKYKKDCECECNE